MTISSSEWNDKIGHRQTLEDILALNLVCPKCEIKLQKELDKIEDYLNGVEGRIKP